MHKWKQKTKNHPTPKACRESSAELGGQCAEEPFHFVGGSRAPVSLIIWFPAAAAVVAAARAALRDHVETRRARLLLALSNSCALFNMAMVVVYLSLLRLSPSLCLCLLSSCLIDRKKEKHRRGGVITRAFCSPLRPSVGLDCRAFPSLTRQKICP